MAITQRVSHHRGWHGCLTCNRSMASVEKTELGLSTPGYLLVRASQIHFQELGLHSGGTPSPLSWPHFLISHMAIIKTITLQGAKSGE